MKIDREASKRLGITVMRTTGTAVTQKKQKKDSAEKTAASSKTEDFLRDE